MAGCSSTNPTPRVMRWPMRRGSCALLESHAPLDLIAGPSGYGLPLRRARDLTETDLRLAYLAVDGEAGGIGGLRSLARALAASELPVVFTPGVIHLGTVPEHRKVNRVDMGTADKVCATALAVRDCATRRDAMSPTSRSFTSSSAARSRPPSRWSTVRSSMASADRRDR